MANGIGRVWAANAGDDEQRPNGVGSVWIENIDALAPSGGASEEQINELSAAIDYVSANAGDPNALTGYQGPGVDISANGSYFVAKGPYDLTVRYGGSALFENSCSAVFTNAGKFIDTNNALISANGGSAVFTNGALVSADGYNGFLVTGYNNYGKPLISATPKGFQTNSNYYDIKADSCGIEISSNYGLMPFKYNTSDKKITLANTNGFAFDVSTNYYSAWIDNHGQYGFSGSNYIGSFGGWNEYAIPPATHDRQGIGFSGSNAKFGIFNGGELKVFNGGKLSASNSCSALFNNASRTEVTNSHTLLVGNNENGTGNGILVSGQGAPYISLYNGGKVKVIDGSEVSLSANTHKIGFNLNASGSRFVSADGEGVSAWQTAPMTVMGMFNQTSSNAAFVIGNGGGPDARSDLFVIDYSGNAKSNDFVANNGAKLSYSIQTSELEFDGNDAITAINGSAIGGGSTYTSPSGTMLIDGDKIESLDYSLFETSSLSANVLGVYSGFQPFTSTFTSALTTEWFIPLSNGDGLNATSVYKTPEGVWINVVTSTHFNNTEDPAVYIQNVNNKISAIDDFTILSAYEKAKVASQNNLNILNNSFTAYKQSNYTNIYDLSSSYKSLNSAFSSFSASVPNIQMVSTSSEATGANILYVVTGSN